MGAKMNDSSIHNRYIPTKLIEAIEEKISEDQGSKYRENLGRVINHISDAFNSDNTPFRSHLGASQLGSECKRAIFYGFRWFTLPKHSGRILRLFNRGHLEEARFIAILLTVGCQVFQQDEHGKQFRISFADGHAGGSSDGIVFNIPDLPNQYILAEFKTHSEKSFVKLQKEGVLLAKPEHHIQMTLYMEKMGIAICLYGAVNKNTDELYWELVTLDKEKANAYIELGTKLVFTEKLPAKINNSPGYWKCRFCEHKPTCHLGAQSDHNCRTCKFSKPIANAEWVCTYTGEILTKEKQLVGCSLHNGDWK
jgi:hypothetical protein